MIRHGLTLPSGTDSHEWPLSPEGGEQAEALADAPFWKNVSTLYSSTEEKAVATIRPASGRHGLEIREDHRLREARRPARGHEDYDEVVRRYLEDHENPPEGWENALEVKARVEESKERHPGENIVVCSHGLAPVLYLSGLPSVKQGVFGLWRSIGFGRVAVLEDGDFVEPFGDPAKVH